jgi:TIR domain
MTGQLFLSHAHADKPEAQAWRRALEDRGVAVWEDVLGLRAGDRLSDLEREVKGSRGLLLLWTPAANESEWVEREAGWARQAREKNPDYRILVGLRGGGRVSAKRLLFIA